MEPFATKISRHIWNTKYRYRRDHENIDQTFEDTWRRVARALSEAEPGNREHWEGRFYDILKRFEFLPAGRIQAGAGTGRNVTLFNCFVMGAIEDSMEGIFRALHEGAVTMQQGGGVGYDFSTLRPRGMRAKGVGALASGPVSFMAVWDAMCETILSTGARRGAMMATLRCDHPDIEEFIDAKRRRGALRNFNLSIQVSDSFISAVRADEDWALVFPSADDQADPEIVMREWPGYEGPVRCRVHGHLRARDLWEKILRATYDCAEPGVLFIDRINRVNNLWYREQISATNPCGEIPLPPYGACDLGSLNLTRFVRKPFTAGAQLDKETLNATTEVATRLLDNVIDVSGFPLREQRETALGTRRIGLGITGLADTLLMLGLDYGSKRATDFAADVMRQICHRAYVTSIGLAKEKGAFPFFDKEKYLKSVFIQTLPESIRSDIAAHGIRNSHLIAIAPTGTISLLANNVSSGLEPVFAGSMTRRVLNADGTTSEFELTDYAVWLWRKNTGDQTGYPPGFLCATDLSPKQHLAMQAALQPFVDNSISKTINVPEDFPFETFRDIYEFAYDKGLKGCTTFRPNPVTGSVISTVEDSANAPHCCAFEREAD